MFFVALRVESDCKLSCKKVAWNLFLQQPKGIDYQISKKEIHKIDKKVY